VHEKKKGSTLDNVSLKRPWNENQSRNGETPLKTSLEPGSEIHCEKC
jgi:hypothetical protein